MAAPKQKKMRTIGRWYIGETLGKGGYSWVKKGFDKKTGKPVALKFIAKADESWTKEQSKQIVTEIESLRHIHHPNVIKLYAYNLHAEYPTNKNEKLDTVLLVLEFASGGELFDILYYTSALETILARTYFRQAIFALEACHNAGVAHRDIKPQNLLLDSHFNIKLTDFGLSKIFETDENDTDNIMHTTYVGTCGYQAPELLLNKAYDLTCDIFSMGVVLFIIITGYPPFEQAHYSDKWFRPLAKCDCNTFWRYHAGCSISNDTDCKDLLQKMLAYDPKQRITIAEIKKHPWFVGRFLQGKGLIRALRHRHVEMEAKRRRDARKVTDLQISITPVRCIGCKLHIQQYPGDIEQVLSNVYCHFTEAREFFELLAGLIGGNYCGVARYNNEKTSMICTVSKIEKSISAITKQDYTFEISLYKSKDYAITKSIEERDVQVHNIIPVEDQAANADEYAHVFGNNKDIVYVATIKRISGDEFKFRGIQRKLLDDGAQIFNGLPEWALKMNDSSDAVFDNVLKDWDKNDAEDNKEHNYDDIQWDKLD